MSAVRLSVERRQAVTKPPYTQPTMAGIAAVPWNGLTHVSTFSGCGGSCCGFALAGYKTLWANDCDPDAIASYRANWSTPLDTRPLQQITAADVLTATGLAPGQLDVLEGSPPCVTFSTAGFATRQRRWHTTQPYAGIEQTNLEDLFYEWLRLVDGLRPRACVAENVSALPRGQMKGHCLAILDAMRGLGYDVAARFLDAQWLGVPQSRSRVIIIGVRTDVAKPPAFPRPLPYRYSALEVLPQLRTALPATELDGAAPLIRLQWSSARPKWRSAHKPCTAITTVAVGLEVKRPGARWTGPPTASAGRCPGVLRRQVTIDECKTLCSFPSDFRLVGTHREQWERLGRAVPPAMMAAIAGTLRDEVLT